MGVLKYGQEDDAGGVRQGSGAGQGRIREDRGSGLDRIQEDRGSGQGGLTLPYCSVCGLKLESRESLGGHMRLCKQKHALESNSRPIESKPNINPLTRWGYDKDAKVLEIVVMLEEQIKHIQSLLERFPDSACFDSRLQEVKRLMAHRDELKGLLQ